MPIGCSSHTDLQGVRNNKARFLQLVTDIQELVGAVVDLRVQSAELTRSVAELVLYVNINLVYLSCQVTILP